jgi:outer membrane protein, heavy metal efflux system
MSLIIRRNGTTRFLFRFIESGLALLLFPLVLVSVSSAQESEAHQAQAVTPLAQLLQEAEQNNPQVQAARQGWKAAQQVPTQVSTLPDPQFQVQHFSVGSPRPFSGYTNSNFAYVGLGFSQEFPYPGKLRLKGEIAKRDADLSQQQYESVRHSVVAQVKEAYFQLAYLSKTRSRYQPAFV